MPQPADQREMRAVYCETLMALAHENENIMVLNADLESAHGLKPFSAAFPGRSLDVGVAEANMVGIAAGLSACGKLPVVHSFSTFATRRCYDQIALAVCYSGLNVKIVGSDPGVGAELNGGTHMGVEDVAIMRALPRMSVVEPADAAQLAAALPAIFAHDGPVYIRMLRKAVPPVSGKNSAFCLGRADRLRAGTDATVIASGRCVAESLRAAESLAEHGLSVEVINMHTIKPLDREAVLDAACRTGALVTAENHSIIGGLGSAVAETLAESHPTPLARVGIQDRFGEVGKTDDLLRVFGIAAQHIAEAVLKVLRLKESL